MTARFRIVHFVPDPFSGGRVPIAALVEVDGKITVANVGSRLDQVLSRRARTAVAAILSELRESPTELARLPMGVGPHAVLGDERQVPGAVDEPVDWVRKVLRASEEADADTPTAERREAGQAFLKNAHVDHLVRRYFTVEQAPAKLPLVLPKISQYVQGDESHLLLLEPVLASVPNLELTLQHVGTSFLAWQRSLEMANARTEPEFIAYVLSDGHRERVAEAREILRTAATRVVDVSSVAERDAFVTRIQDVGRTQYLQ